MPMEAPQVRRFKFNLPDYYVALVRALLTLEGIALAADCAFDVRTRHFSGGVVWG